MMNRLLRIAPFLMLVACGGSKKTVETPVVTPVEQRPSWVGARPSSDGYYTGIGMANKSRPDVLETAKKNALNDLASEISVRVEGNSLLYTLDRKNQFDESFTGTIKTTSNEQLEGFELVDSWENATEYWTYYRLSKAEHARIKAEKKAGAIRNALDLHARGKQSIGNGDLRTAFDQELRALLAMKEYWGENDAVELDGRQVQLVNELYAELQKLTSQVRLTALPERAELSYENGFKRELMVSAAYANGGGLRDLGQLPLFITYPGTGGKVTELKNTDTEGRARTTVQRVDPGSKLQEVLVKLHLDELISRELDRALAGALLASLTAPEVHVPIVMRMPRVFMRSKETNLGQPVGDAGVSSVVREELTTKGFRFVEREGEADLLLDLSANTRQGGESNGFFTAFVDVTYTFRDRKTQEVVFEGGKQGVKGVQLTYEKAGLESFKKAIPDIRKELVPGIMNAFN
ncbi:MAG: LPP20 family lipoprotein [Flavobacteriales bacterium]|nr:LPP20 family lipoprotein [Flavobacteriales bacterium]